VPDDLDEALKKGDVQEVTKEDIDEVGRHENDRT
jgi:hypothetical protein